LIRSPLFVAGGFIVPNVSEELTINMLPDSVRAYLLVKNPSCSDCLDYSDWGDMLKDPAGRACIHAASGDFDVSETDRREYGSDGYWSEITVTGDKDYIFEFSEMY
jgi:hypothetical protein